MGTIPYYTDEDYVNIVFATAITTMTVLTAEQELWYANREIDMLKRENKIYKWVTSAMLILIFLLIIFIMR